MATSLHVPGFAHGQNGSAAETDPATLSLMQGAPVPADKQVRWTDGSMWRFPQQRWAFSHMRELVPTVNIGREGAVSVLPVALRDDLDDVRLTTLDGQAMTWRDSLAATYTDAILVMKNGVVVYERHFGATTPSTQHILFSVTKSFVGTIAEMLIEEGRIKPDAKAAEYVAELAGSGLGDATIREILDMRTGLAFSEDYVPGQTGLTDVQRMSISTGWVPRLADYAGPDGNFVFSASLGKNAPHGGDFVYRTPNTTALQWIIERIEGQSLAAQIEARFWARMGMDHDAALGVDRVGTGFGGGGLMASLRDIARIGEMMRLGGRYNDQQIVPAAVVERIFAGGDPAAFVACQYTGNLDGNYRSQWWHRAGGQLMAMGVHGQGIYVDRGAGVVIARLGSHPVASNRGNAAVTTPAYDAIVAALQ
ncbi:serine hydrolase domain-containing protein [Sandarakinorhabdus limnophila]|uniref:serine hydrolase domain-containing protein n=1 Tax=Sandarakinorhabdus limnophila TaxID=210512 RepID=UPI0026EADA80|nr:serine hydrolase [Sandarakinorhabdus limnophila]MCM0033786.1 beta-lactamase family protein [Sandarakinorhabdus limnophila]